MSQHPRHGVAQHGVPHVSDMRGFVGVDAGVFDNYFAGTFRCGRARCFPLRLSPERRTIEVGVQVSRARDFQFGDPRNGPEIGGDLLCDLPRRAL